MKKIKNYLSQWVSEGLISRDQEIKILEFEETKSNDNKSKWVLYGFLVLGVSVVTIGLISLVAANWDKIPGIVKLTNMFLILCILAYFILQFDTKKNDILFDALSVLFIFLCLAAIGLISQVFHTGGEMYQALLIWVLIVFPLSLYGKREFLPALWVTSFILLFFTWSFSKDSYWYYLDNRINDDNAFTIFLTLPLVTLFLGELLSRFELLKRYAKYFKIFAFLSVFLAFIAVDTHFSAERYKYSFDAFIPVGIFATGTLFLLFFQSVFSKKEKIIISIIIFCTILIFVPNFWGNEIDSHDKKVGQFIGACYHIIMLIILSMFFIIRNNKKLFNIITMFIGARFLIVYFQVFGSLATTGFGLIISGLIIICAAVLWFKKKEKFENWIGDLIK